VSSNSGPAKVRVLSSGTPEWNPARRRGDGPGRDADAVRGAQGGNAADANASVIAGGDATRIQGGEASNSMLWIAGAVLLFVLGSTIGGVLVTISVLFPGVL
jgi:hypothetical protein